MYCQSRHGAEDQEGRGGNWSEWGWTGIAPFLSGPGPATVTILSDSATADHNTAHPNECSVEAERGREAGEWGPATGRALSRQDAKDVAYG